MPLPIARIGDLAAGSNCYIDPLCCPHDWCGPIITGAARTTCENKRVARVTDLGATTCPHGGIFIIVKGAKRSFCENKPIARVTDMVVCTKCGSVGFIISGATRSFCEN